MARRLNVFGEPLSYDVGVRYVNGKPVLRDRDINVDNDDVSEVTKKTAVEYASDLTKGKEGSKSNKNKYPVTGEAVERTLETPSGTTPELSSDSNGGKQHVPPSSRMGMILQGQVDDKEGTKIEVQPSDVHMTYTGDTSIIKKGKSKTGLVDGHDLLAKPDGTIDKNVTEKYVSPILRNNRFNPTKTLSSIVGNDKKFNPDHPQEGYGSYKKHAGLGKDLSDGHIANVGPMLTLRATKELNAASDTGYGQDGPDGTGAKLASYLPGGAQVGLQKVATDDLQVDSVLRALIAGDTEPANVSAGSSGNRRVIDQNDSYGQMNNALEQFSGLLPIGMIAAATALTLALNVALRALLALFLLITNASNSNSVRRDNLGRFIPGDSRYNPAFQKVSFPPIPLPAKLFGLQETVNPFGDAVNEGIKTFFGGSPGGSLSRILESPGFYATFCRTIVRSAADLGRIMSDVTSGNPIQIAENIIGLVDAIKTSRLIAVMNMFAQLGDASLTQLERAKRFDPKQDRTNDSEIDNLEGLNAMMSRQKDSLRLAWGASTTASSLLLPKSIMNGLYNTSRHSAFNLQTNVTNIVAENENAKINKFLVESMERNLDAEYLPFYFHDLRTNEIVSFHAFLASLSEDFTANYESMEGYGRIDAVKIYKNTNRKIGISFHVVATNQEDFNAMWLKINKLTTLVYPQWTRGTGMTDGETKFVQPFSQVPGASPLIRLRVGDLWTSNYSKFSLARIFGYGTNDFSVGKEKLTEFGKVSSGIIELQKSITGDKGVLKKTSTWMLEPGDYETSAKQDALGAAGAAIGGIASAVGLPSKVNARVTLKIRVPTRVEIIEPVKNSTTAYLVKLEEGDATGIVNSDLKKAAFVVSVSHLSVCNETYSSYNLQTINNNFFEDKTKVQDGAKLTKASEFFSVENNAIFKSFESTSGRGLACLIESMNFDWNQVPWMTHLEGSRAPMMCKISMNFAVVHDIAPGVDHTGFNRAPIYNVGRQSNAISGRNVSDANNKFGEAMKKIRKSTI